MTRANPKHHPVLLLNNRTTAFYDFEALQKDFGILPILVMNRPSYESLPLSVKRKISRIHIIELGDQKPDPVYAFPYDEIAHLFEKERQNYPELSIIGADEMSTLIAAQVRSTFQIPGTSLHIINVYRNKITQKKKLQECGIVVPAFAEVDLHQVRDFSLCFNELRTKLGDGFIIKPALSSATVGVKRVGSAQDLKNYQDSFAHMGPSIAESFISGQLYHVDFIIQSGTYIFEEVCEYVWNGLSFVSGKNHGSLMLSGHHPLRERILSFAREANDALGLTNGCVHMEIFVTSEQEIFFLEAGPRPAGSLVPYVYSQTYKRPFMNAALLAEIGIPQDKFTSAHLHGFWGLFPKINGSIVAKHVPEMQSPNTIEWFVDVGESVCHPSSIAEKAGQITAFSANHTELRQDFESLRTFQALTVS